MRFFLLILLSGCASMDVIEPKAGRTFIAIDFYNNIEQLRVDCASSNNPHAKGCSGWSPSRGACLIRVIKSQKCLDHEMDHCIHGDFHPRDVNTPCEVRAGG